MKEVLGFTFVILSAFPMGFAEGKIIDMKSDYSFTKVAPLVLLYLIGFALYLAGFMQIPTKIGFIIGIWEISAVLIGVGVAVSSHNIKIDSVYMFWFTVLVASTYVLGMAADKILSRAGIE